jgi:hypothetical protein
MAFAIDYDGLFSRAGRVDIDGVAVPVLALEDEFVTTCAHASKHEWTELKWVCDVAALVAWQPDIDWGCALERAREQGCLRMCLLGLALAASLLDCDVPEPAESLLKDDPVAQRLAGDVARSMTSPLTERGRSPARLSAFHLRMRERWRDKAKCFVRTLATPASPHVAFVSLPARWSSLYFVVAPAHDFVLLPLYHLYRRASAWVVRPDDGG